VLPAARAAGIHRATHYRWLGALGEPYVGAVQEALDDYADELEFVAARRATRGTRKGIFWQGIQVATEREYSDALLIQLLKAKRPKQYREKLALEAGEGGPIPFTFVMYAPPPALAAAGPTVPPGKDTA
jgi:hypothetical protein